MKLFALIISIMILSVTLAGVSQNDSYVYIGTITHGNVILDYKGNASNLISYLSKYGISVYGYGNYYLLNGNWNSISLAFKINGDSAYLPSGIAIHVINVFSGVPVNSNIAASHDPYFVKYIVNAYGVSYLQNHGINGSGYSAVVIVPYGDPDLFKNFEAFNKLNDLPNGTLEVKYFFSQPNLTEQNWTTETDLDVEMIHAFAPGAKIIVAVAPSDNSTTLEYTLLRVINERLGDVISLSWGGPEAQVYNPFFHYILKRAAMAGITVIAASGDSPDVEYPASDPYVLSVGGTTLILSNGEYNYEGIWASSGGGFSTIFHKPPWQIGPGNFSTGGRGVPDISLDGNPQTGVYIYSGSEIAVGGTSMSAPMFAGMVLDLEQKERFTFGFFTPQLYYMSIQNGSEFFNHIYNRNSPVLGWYPHIGLGSPKILDWNFSEKTFFTGVYVGNYTNVTELSFNVRGFNEAPYHRNENDVFYIQLSNGSRIFNLGFSQTERRFFYFINGTVFLNLSVLNDHLYYVSLYFGKNRTFIHIDNSNITAPAFTDNFSINVFASSTGDFSFYSNLGPSEFRNFKIVMVDGKTMFPERLVSIQKDTADAYGAVEIPFLRNDFLIGAVGVPGESVLWPRNFSYINSGMINGNFIFNIPNLIGTGTPADPYIISGVRINSTSAGFFYQGDQYFVLNHCIIDAPVGIVLFGGHLRVIDSRINSQLGIISFLSTLIVINSTFKGFAGIYAPFSIIFTLWNVYLNVYPEIIIFQFIGGNIILYIAFLVTMVVMYFLRMRKNRRKL